MNKDLLQVIDDVHSLANELKNYTERKIENIATNIKVVEKDSLPQKNQTNNFSYPGRPWKIGGGVSAGIGVIGILCSSGSVWPYLLTVVGAGALYVGYSKDSNQNSDIKASSSNSNIDLDRIANMLSDCARTIENDWKNGIENLKTKVQSIITSSDVSEETKQHAFSLTYSTERLHIDYNSVIDEIYQSDETNIPIIISRFKKQVIKGIDDTADSQIRTYQEIGENI